MNFFAPQEAARPSDGAAASCGRVQPFRHGRAWLRVLAVGGVAAAAFRAPGVASDARAAFAHLGGLRLPWLSVVFAAQIVSLAAGAAAQRQLLAAGGVSLPWRGVFAVVLGSTGLARVMPAGPVTAAAWQAREYRRRGTGAAPGVWAVLAGGFTSTAVILALLLAGVAIAGAGSLPLLACPAVALAAGAALTTAACPARALSRWLSRRPRRSPRVARLAVGMAGLARFRTGFRQGIAVLAFTSAGLLADTGVLAACFGLAGLPVPWRGLLFAHAAGQLAGRLVPLPGGLGGVEGGVLGALTLVGIPPTAAAAAVIVYRVAGYWPVGAAGTAAAAFARRRAAPS